MKQQSTSKGFAILSIASILCKVLSLVYVPLQTAIVGYSGNGMISSGYRIYIFMFSLSNAGLPIALSKLISESDAVGNYKGSKKIFRVSTVILLLLGLLFALMVLFGVGWITKYINQPDAALMIMAFAPAFIFTSITCALRGYFQGKRNMVPTAVSQVVEQTLNSVLTVVFAALLIGYGVKYAAAGTTIGTTIGAMGAAVYLFYIYRQTKQQRIQEIRSSDYDGPQRTTGQIVLLILTYAIPAILNSVSTSAVDLIDVNLCTRRLIAGGHVSDANALFGIYSYQYQRLSTIALAVSMALVTAIIPAISAANARGDFKGLRLKIRESFKAVFIVTIPMVAGMTFLAQPILSFIFFRNNKGADLIVYGVWSTVLMAILYVQSGVLIGMGRPYAAPVNTIIGMVAKVILNYVLIAIPSINIMGAVIGTAASWLIAVILNQLTIQKSVPGKLKYFHLMVVPSIVSIIMGTVCLLAYHVLYQLLNLIIPSHLWLLSNDLALLVCIPLGAAIYYVLMVLLRGIRTEDIKRLPMGGRFYRLTLRFSALKRALES